MVAILRSYLEIRSASGCSRIRMLVSFPVHLRLLVVLRQQELLPRPSTNTSPSQIAILDRWVIRRVEPSVWSGMAVVIGLSNPTKMALPRSGVRSRTRLLSQAVGGRRREVAWEVCGGHG